MELVLVFATHNAFPKIVIHVPKIGTCIPVSWYDTNIRRYVWIIKNWLPIIGIWWQNLLVPIQIPKLAVMFQKLELNYQQIPESTHFATNLSPTGIIFAAVYLVYMI